MKQKLSFANRIWIGFTLFSMFLGAGSLPFVPYLGFCAGSSLWRGMAGFWVSGVFLPLLGAGAAASAGGLNKLAARIHPRCALVIPPLFSLLFGPLFLLPKAAQTSCLLNPLLFNEEKPDPNLYLCCLLGFFILVYLFSLRPERLSNRIGKVTVPCLLFLIALIFVGCVFWPMGQRSVLPPSFAGHPLLFGFLKGYQEMGIVMALACSTVFMLTIREKGVTSDNLIRREAVITAVIAGVMLTLIYGALAFIGSLAGTGLPTAKNGAEILSWAANELYGKNGLYLLAMIFFISCLNVSAGLICCCSDIFSRQFPKLPYPVWAAVFSGISFAVTVIRPELVFTFSLPVINCIYPAVLVLLLLSLIHPWICRLPLLYPFCILAAVLAGIAANLEKIKLL